MGPRRLDEPSRDNNFGRVGDTRALERSWLPGYQARMRRTCGVAVVDATAPLESVIESILSLTEPAVPTPAELPDSRQVDRPEAGEPAASGDWLTVQDASERAICATGAQRD
jgi:hypothetical protein